MNTHIVALYITTKFALEGLGDRMKSERGQTSVEWLGIATVVGLILVVLVGKGEGWGNTIAGKIDQIITDVSAR